MADKNISPVSGPGRTVLIATPCYNESESLPGYFTRVASVRETLERSGWKTELLLIDDGSRDDTFRLLDDYARRTPKVTVVAHPRNLGYGAAIKTAMAHCRTDWLAFVDADTNYDQQLVVRLLGALTPSDDILNVSIFAPNGSVGFPWYRKLLSSSASLLYRGLFPFLTRGVYTMTCGFRVYRASIIPKVFPIADDFFATAEILLRALRAGVRVRDFPATNGRRLQGVSKMRVVRNSAGHLRLALGARFGKLPPAPPPQEHLSYISPRPTAKIAASL